MKARIPKHREFVIDIKEEDEARQQGKSVYTETFIEDNEEKVKALQQEYQFEYTIELV